MDTTGELNEVKSPARTARVGTNAGDVALVENQWL
jgi:hypothetical protein